MSRMTCATPVAVATAVASLFVQACSGGNGTTARDAGSEHDSGSEATGNVVTHAPTMTAIYGEVLAPKCAQAFCHLGLAGSPPIFSDKEASYRALVNVPAAGTKCGDAGAAGLMRVVPGDPDASLLYRKIETPTPAGLCGDPMPGGGQPSLDSLQVQQIHDWIAQGAQDD